MRRRGSCGGSWWTSALGLAALLASAGCNPGSECMPGSGYCRGNTAVTCDLAWSERDAPYVWQVDDCADGEYPHDCAMRDGRPQCVPRPMPEPDPGKAIRWLTGSAVLGADALEIEAAGLVFTAAGVVPAVDSGGSSGPPDPIARTTLEATWQEHGVEMRLYFYLVRDATSWWCERMATYNGLPPPDGNWLTYEGPFFSTPMGEWYRGDVDLTTTNPAPGALRIRGLELRAFR